MKKTLFTILFAFVTTFTFAETKSDTIVIDQEYITSWIADSTLNTKGKSTIKYYCIYKGELIATNKTTLKNVSLCKKYKAKCALVLITSKTGRKRIVCN